MKLMLKYFRHTMRRQKSHIIGCLEKSKTGNSRQYWLDFITRMSLKELGEVANRKPWQGHQEMKATERHKGLMFNEDIRLDQCICGLL